MSYAVPIPMMRTCLAGYVTAERKKIHSKKHCILADPGEAFRAMPLRPKVTFLPPPPKKNRSIGDIFYSFGFFFTDMSASTGHTDVV